MRLVALMMAAGAILASCATTTPPHPATALTCLPIAAYTAQDQQQAAAKIAALPADDILVRMITDYGAMRAADRAACGTTP